MKSNTGLRVIAKIILEIMLFLRTFIRILARCLIFLCVTGLVLSYKQEIDGKTPVVVGLILSSLIMYLYDKIIYKLAHYTNTNLQNY